jgi:hypothetical protein
LLHVVILPKLGPGEEQAPMIWLEGGPGVPGTINLENSRVVIIPAMTHMPVGLDHMECLDRIMDAFFSTGSVRELDASCVAAMNPPPFATSEDPAGRLLPAPS